MLMVTRLFSLVVIAVSLIGTRAAANTPPTSTEGSIVVGNRTRTYLLHVPPTYDGTTPLPLVVVLHGGGGHAWPGGDRVAAFLDAPTTELIATDAIWDFFVQHPRQ